MRVDKLPPPQTRSSEALHGRFQSAAIYRAGPVGDIDAPQSFNTFGLVQD